jgi:hypothetical protein
VEAFLVRAVSLVPLKIEEFMIVLEKDWVP